MADVEELVAAPKVCMVSSLSSRGHIEREEMLQAHIAHGKAEAADASKGLYVGSVNRPGPPGTVDQVSFEEEIN